MGEQNKLTWMIDPGHSSIQFKVKHLGIAYVAGVFSKFEGKAVCENEDLSGAGITFTIDAESVTTHNERRDEHLRSDIFLDVAHFPQIAFNGQLEKSGADYVLAGDLSLRGVTRNIQLAVEMTGTGMGRHGDVRAGFGLQGKISRKDFGITLEILTGTGSLVAGEDIRLYIDVELIKQ
jgi:polyisoprenoid-binding protein YceI